ncbi:hypothetical protein ACFLVQ_00850 [Chloroflexota bacterium]
MQKAKDRYYLYLTTRGAPGWHIMDVTEPEITTYMKQIEEQFEELRYEEPIEIPDVFMKEFDNPL